MKLYVPEIGDQLTLEKDWTFQLHAEGRNETLGLAFGYHLTNSGWVKADDLAPMRETDYEVNYPSQDDPKFRKMFGGISYDAYRKACKEAEAACPAYVKYWEDYSIWQEKAKSICKQEIEITIPAGFTIKVDRIYIRKGAADYSSITWFVTGLGEVTTVKRYSWQKTRTARSLRFWTKLADCNKIEFKA